MSLYSLIARINLKAAVLRLLKDNPDGLNMNSIKEQLGTSTLKTRKIINSLLDNKSVREIEVGKSRVIIYEHLELSKL